MLLARARQIVGESQAWSDRAIRDTVAKIANEAKFTRAPRESLLGRLFRYLWDRLFEFLAWLHGRGDARFYLYATVVLVIGVVVARVLVARQLVEARNSRPGRTHGGGNGRDLWASAQSAAAQGRFDEACHALYGAVLDDLAREGVIRLHASKTGGDYAREMMRRNFARVGDYRAFVRTFDRVAFGTADVDASDYESVRTAALALFQQRAAA
jgi:hypothetical protein